MHTEGPYPRGTSLSETYIDVECLGEETEGQRQIRSPRCENLHPAVFNLQCFSFILKTPQSITLRSVLFYSCRPYCLVLRAESGSKVLSTGPCAMNEAGSNGVSAEVNG